MLQRAVLSLLHGLSEDWYHQSLITEGPESTANACVSQNCWLPGLTCISRVAARSSACCTACCSTCSFTSALAALCEAFSASVRACSKASSARFALHAVHAIFKMPRVCASHRMIARHCPALRKKIELSQILSGYLTTSWYIQLHKSSELPIREHKHPVLHGAPYSFQAAYSLLTKVYEADREPAG